MIYEDELGFKLVIPRAPNESVVDHIKTTRACLTELLRIQEKWLEKNTCKNPIVVKVGVKL